MRRTMQIFSIGIILGLTGSVTAEAGGLFDRLFGSREKQTSQTRGSSALDSSPLPVPSYLQQIILEAAQETGLDPNLIVAVVYQESRFKTQAVSSRGAQGLMQLMPRTAKYLGVENPFDARENVFGGSRYLVEMFEMFNGDLELSLAAYNAGPYAVKEKGPSATDEAVHYVRAVKSFYRPTQKAPWVAPAAIPTAG